MLAVLAIVTPVFALIGLGYLAARTRYLSDGAGRVLAEFGFKVAMPALLFRAMLSVGEMPGSPMLLLIAYFSATATVWLTASVLNSVLLRRPATEAAAIGMGACFGNTVMLGIPLALTAFGPQAATPMALLIAIETPLLWVIATLHMEASRRGRQMSFSALGSVLWDLVRNPIVMALIVGLAWRETGLGMAPMVDKITGMLAQAAVPSALFALGMTLASFQIRSELKTLTLLCVLKLVLYPVIAYVMTVHVFALPPLWSAIAVLFAAMPVGANAYLFAARYQTAEAPVSGAIAVSTLIAVVTVSTLLYVIGKPV
jgi:malonate transporter and related proteins